MLLQDLTFLSHFRYFSTIVLRNKIFILNCSFLKLTLLYTDSVHPSTEIGTDQNKIAEMTLLEHQSIDICKQSWKQLLNAVSTESGQKTETKHMKDGVKI